MKTSTLSDEIYEKLIRIKRNRSFSQLIDYLIIQNVDKRIEFLISAAKKTGYEEELEEISKKIRIDFKVRS